MSVTKNTKLVLKNIKSGKHASNQDIKLAIQLQADELDSSGRGGGIIDALVPQNPQEKTRLAEQKKTYKVKKVVSRTTQNGVLRNYFTSDIFMVELGEWILKYHQNARNFSIEQITNIIASAQETIITSGAQGDQKLLDLQDIFTEYSPELFDHKRKNQWWETRIKSRKR